MTAHSDHSAGLFGELLSLSAALILLAAFLFLPWYALDDDAGMVTGYRIAADTAGDLDLAGRASHMFLLVVPLAALSALALALWGLSAAADKRAVPGLLLVSGLVVLGYYYGTFFFENRTSSQDATVFLGSGFYVGLFAALGLVLQAIIPRPWGVHALHFSPLVLPPIGQARAWWRWPGTLLRGLLRWIGALFGWVFRHVSRAMAGTPMLAYLLGLWAATRLEQSAGSPLAELLGFRRGRIPVLFGATNVLEPFSNLDFSGILAPFFPSPSVQFEAPLRDSWNALRQVADTFSSALTTSGAREPGFFDVLQDVIIYDLLIYVIPILVVALLLKGLSNAIISRLPLWGALTLQLVVLYLAVDTWGNLSDYRDLVLIYMGVNIMLSVSLNLVNGYMGEFSVGHAGFMAIGAYVASVLTMWLFVDEKVFGPAVLSVPGWALTIGFVIALIAGGAAAAIAGLLVAFPSFRTRGDYLAIVTLAVNFIVTGMINNIEGVGGPRGLNGVPIWTDLRWIFIVTVLSVVAIHNLVSSTFGKGIIAIREDEIAAGLMGVNTRRMKLVAFLVSSFIAGVSGGLFAHVLAYVNPGMFGILKSTEALVMVYLGGMGSISGSVIAAVIFTILIEAFRPLAVLKWVVVPLILIFLMLYRPQGLFGFREINLNLGGAKPAPQPEKEPVHDTAAD